MLSYSLVKSVCLFKVTIVGKGKAVSKAMGNQNICDVKGKWTNGESGLSGERESRANDRIREG